MDIPPARQAGSVSRRRSSGPQRYDFRRPNKLSREHIRALQLANETLARQFSTILTTTLRAISQVGLVTVEQLSYDEYINALDNPTFAALFQLDPLEGTAVLEFSLPTAMTAVDHLLGGTGGPQPQRAPTEIETTLLRGLVSRVLQEISYSFESLVKLTPKLDRIELNPQFAAIGAPADVMIVATFEMRVGSQESVATLCLPFAALEPVLAEVTARNDRGAGQASRSISASRAAKALVEVPIQVDVRFDPVQLSSGQLLSLAVGDVLKLGHSLSTPLSVTADGITCAKAMPGSTGRRLAVLIVTPEERS